jgi:hypothetical protein
MAATSAGCLSRDARVMVVEPTQGTAPLGMGARVNDPGPRTVPEQTLRRFRLSV